MSLRRLALILIFGGLCFGGGWGLGPKGGGDAVREQPPAAENAADQAGETLAPQAPPEGIGKEILAAENGKQLARLIARLWEEAPREERTALLMLALARWAEVGGDAAENEWGQFAVNFSEGRREFLPWRDRGKVFIAAELARGQTPLPAMERLVKGGDAATMDEIGKALAIEHPGDTATLDAWLAEHEASGNARFGSRDLPGLGMINAFAIEWARSDPGAALDWTKQIPERWRPKALGSLFKHFAQEDSEFVIEKVAELEPSLRGDIEADIVEGLAGRDPETAMEWLFSQHKIDPPFVGHTRLPQSFDRLAARLAGMETPDALAFFERFFPTISIKPNEVHYTGGRVVKSMPAALAPAASYIDQLSGREPEVARELAEQPASDVRDALLASALEHWAYADPQAAADAALAACDGDDASLQRLASQLAIPLGGAAPERGLEIAARLEGDLRGAFLELLATSGARENPQAAAEAVVSLADGALGVEATRAFASAWAGDDLMSTSEWLGTLEEGAARDAGVGALVEAVAKFEPDSAFEWAQTITDPAARLSAITEAAAQWNALAPATAGEVFARAGLSDSERAAALAAELPQSSNPHHDF